MNAVGGMMGWAARLATFCLGALLLQACGDQSAGTPSAPQPTVPTVALSTPAGAVSRGDVFALSVEVYRLEETSYAAFDVVYDPAVLEFQGASDRTFLSNRGLDGTLFQAALPDGIPGRVTIGMSRVARVRGVSGGGTLLSLSFKALRAGTTTLAFGDPRTIRNSDHREVSIQAWEDLVITVR